MISLLLNKNSEINYLNWIDKAKLNLPTFAIQDILEL